jgi:hypothetical protein
MFKFLTPAIFLFIAGMAQLTFAAPAQLGIIEVDQSGAPLKLSFQEAILLCQSKGMTLPTVMEYALLSEARGRSEIRKSQFTENHNEDPAVRAEIRAMRNDGFMTVFHKNILNDIAVWFYLSSESESYSVPSSEAEKSLFWALDPASDDGSAYTFNGKSGFIHWVSNMAITSQNRKAAVQCAAKQN